MNPAEPTPIEPARHQQLASPSGEAGSDYPQLLASAAARLEAILQRMDDLSRVDECLEHIDQLLDACPQLLATADTDQLAYLVFVALTLRHPRHPRLELWKARVFAIFEQHPDTSLRILCGLSLFANGHLSGERGGLQHFFQVLRQLAEKPDVAPLARIAERLVSVWYLGIKGEPTESLAAFEEGLRLARTSNIHLWDGLLFVYAITAALNEADTQGAAALLKRMESELDNLTILDRIFFHHLQGWRALLEQDLGTALFHQKRALTGVTKLGLQNRIEGICHFGLAVILHDKGEAPDALHHLNRCREIGRSVGSCDLTYLCDLTQAQIALDAGETDEAARLLRLAMEAARELGLLKFTYWRAEVMTRLCCHALEHDIAVDCVMRMIRHFDLFPPNPPWQLKHWPWVVRIQTLGGFSLRVNGKETVFSAKTPKKSLELLKALIAFGPAPSETMLADLLWPDVEGDSAMRSLEITLHRLRKLLGDSTLIRRAEGKLCLDQRRIFVDTWALEALTEHIPAQAEQTEAELGRACRRLSAVYPGVFLPGDESLAWTHPLRQKLAQRFLRGVLALGRQCEARGLYDTAALLYQQALERAEDGAALCRQLLECLLRAGRRGEALDLYRRNQEKLNSLSVSPEHGELSLFEHPQSLN